MSDKPNWDEEGYTHQQLAMLRNKIEKLTVVLSEKGINKTSLDAAMLIEDIFVKSNNDRLQRLARVQVIIKGVITNAIAGENGVGLSDIANTTKPLE